jgi:predicted transcriptional regulator
MQEPFLRLEGKVADVMSKNPIVLRKEDGLDKLIDMFKTYHYHGFPVVEENQQLVGIVRDTEVVSIFARKDPAAYAYRKVEDIMRTPPLVIEPEETIQTAIVKMFADQTRFLVVINKDKEIVGIVTRVDLIRGIQVDS